MRGLCISTTFLSGTYHGQEWPPAPARLMQAMVAGVMTGRYRERRAVAEPGLRWLERQPPPVILAVDGKQSAVGYRLAVPNNDGDVAARNWAAGREFDTRSLVTMKDVRPYRVEEAKPHVRYVWQVSEGDDVTGLLTSLRTAAECLHTFGWGVDMSYAEVHEAGEEQQQGEELSRWTPTGLGGEPLAVPLPGFLEDLDRAYERFRRRAVGAGADADTHPTLLRMQGYVRMEDRQRPHLVLGMQRMGEDNFHSEGWERAVVVAGQMRHAAAMALRAEGEDDAFVTSYVEGHGEGEEKNRRVSYVPLPTIGAPHADGRIRRMMFVEPEGSAGRVIERLGSLLPGMAAIEEASEREVWTFGELIDSKVTQWYTGRSRVWQSVTPVVLHGHNTAGGRLSLKKTDRLLVGAFAMAGHSPELIEEIRYQAAPFWNKTGAAAQIRMPKHLQNLPRLHVEVRFRKQVTGPVLAGIGRHSGLGVFGRAG